MNPITLADLRRPLPSEQVADQQWKRLEREVAAYEVCFEAMQNKAHWKGPIDAVVDLTKFELAVYEEACAWYTGTRFRVTSVHPDGRSAYVASVGYWGGPCA